MFKSNLAWHDAIVKISFIVAAVFSAGGWYLVFLKAWPLRKILPFFSLHYTVYSGVDWVDRWYFVFLYPLFGLLALGGNFWLTSHVYMKERLYSYMLGSATVLLEMILLVYIIFLLSINIQAR